MSADGVRVGNHFTIPEHELDWRFGPSGGPGGQHANRAHTRAELRWAIGASAIPSDAQRRRLLERLGDPVLVVVDDHRSQTRNRELARRRLGERVAGALRRERPRIDTRPTRGSKRRRVEEKRRRGLVKRQRRRPTGDE